MTCERCFADARDGRMYDAALLCARCADTEEAADRARVPVEIPELAA